MTKVLLICSTSNQIITFRKGLIEKLMSEGCGVYTIAFDDENRDVIEQRGITHFSVSGANRSLNPFKILSLKNRYAKIIKQVQPDIVFTFMLKPNIFGVRAAKKAKVNKIFAMVEGAGDVFINDGFKWKLIRAVVCKMYRKSFKQANKVFFINNDDRNEFIARKLVSADKCVNVAGIGVDLEHFAYRPLKNDKTFLMIARMLRTKGVIEYCKAARIVKNKYPDAVFNYLGGEGNVTVADIQEYIDDGSVNYLGTTTDVRPYIEDCAAYVLPSYREGMPVSIMEAECVGRCVITNNVPGCKDTVTDGYNGYIVERGDYEALADSIIHCIENPSEVETFGQNGRKLAEEKFDKNVINDTIYELMNS